MRGAVGWASERTGIWAGLEEGVHLPSGGGGRTRQAENSRYKEGVRKGWCAGGGGKLRDDKAWVCVGEFVRARTHTCLVGGDKEGGEEMAGGETSSFLSSYLAGDRQFYLPVDTVACGAGICSASFWKLIPLQPWEVLSLSEEALSIS